MKRIIAIFLAICILLTGCATHANTTPEDNQTTTLVTEPVVFENISEPALLDYIEETVYSNLLEQLNSDDYLVDNIQAIYVSQEYLDELSYNSQSNIYFGYTLAELDAFFQDTRYVFTLADDGTTTVKAFEAYDDSYDKMIKNISIGTGVILVCVTVSIVSRAAGAAAVSMVFAASAKTGAIGAAFSSIIGGVTSGVVTGIETKDVNAALKAAAVDGSEGFKWGAIGGALSGGLETTASLYGAARNGLTMNQAAMIQQESKLPLAFIKNFHSVEEYNVYKNAGLTLSKINGKLAFTQKINWDLVDDAGRTNAQRIADGLNPIDSNGLSYELHHIGQKADSPLAILSNEQHKKNYAVLHKNTGGVTSEVDHGTAWTKQKKDFWESLYKMATGGA